MNALFTVLLTTLSFGAFAQHATYCKEVTTDGRQLRIRLDIRDQDRSVQYSRSFDVSGMSRADVRALEDRIVDSVEVTTQQPAAVARAQARTSDGGVVKMMASNGRIPYEEAVEEDLPEGRLKVRFTFLAGGQSNVVEKSANVRDTTEEGRRKLRVAIERQLTAEMEQLVGEPGV